MESDGGRPVVAGAGGFARFLDAVVVVAGAFDRAGAGAVTAEGVEFAGDGSQDVGLDFSPALRGERPPYQWRCGGRCAGCG